MLIEITTFRLAGTDEQGFAEADARFQAEFVYAQPGLIRRTTARGRDDEWLVLTFWGSARDADAAATAAREDPVAQAWRSLVDAGSVRAERFTTLD